MLRPRLLALTLLLTLAACQPSAPPAFVASAKTTAKLAVRPGTPRDEKPPLEGVVRLHGETFYDRFLDLSEADQKALAALIADPASYRAHVEGKKCGGFHADYAIEWKQDGQPYLVMLCFGCHEAWSVGDGGERLNDLTDPAYEGLVRILNRANHEE